MKRYLPFAIILGALLVALGAGALLFRFRQPPEKWHRLPADGVKNHRQDADATALGKPGAEPAHVRGPANAPVALEEFGDFECLPCFMLWPAMKNIEKDYAKSLSVTFRQHPLAQHRHALEAARASEAAGLQGRFWEMHDLLYLKRSKWVRAEDVRAFFNTCASELGLDLERFTKDMDGEEVAKRIAADQGVAAFRSGSIGRQCCSLTESALSFRDKWRKACARRLMQRSAKNHGNISKCAPAMVCYLSLGIILCLHHIVPFQ